MFAEELMLSRVAPCLGQPHTPMSCNRCAPRVLMAGYHTAIPKLLIAFGGYAVCVDYDRCKRRVPAPLGA
jgi:hypothetical protein